MFHYRFYIFLLKKCRGHSLRGESFVELFQGVICLHFWKELHITTCWNTVRDHTDWNTGNKYSAFNMVSMFQFQCVSTWKLFLTGRENLFRRITLLPPDSAVEVIELVLSVCLSVRVCGTYIVHHCNDTTLCTMGHNSRTLLKTIERSSQQAFKMVKH